MKRRLDAPTTVDYIQTWKQEELHEAHLYQLEQWYSTFFPPVPLETLFHSTLYPQSYT
jgi:hypothetical protein